MRTNTFLAIVLLGLLLAGCGDSTTTSTTSTVSSEAPIGTATTASPDTPAGSDAVPATEAGPGTEDPQTDATDGITFEEDLLNPTLAPAPPVLETTSEGPVLRWKGTGPDLSGYLVYSRPAPDEDWTLVGEVAPEGDNLAEYSYAVPAATGEWAIVAVDLDGNRSEFSIAIAD